jgi:hypothetical protein
LTQCLSHEAPLVSLAALSSLNNALREQVARSIARLSAANGLSETCSDATQRQTPMPELSWYRHRMYVFQEA